MGTKTVRLDEEAEKILQKLMKITGLSISELLKRGLLAYKTKALQKASEKPYDTFCRLNLGKGGYSAAPAKEAKLAEAEIIKMNHGL
jgi:hypothetical protein